MKTNALSRAAAAVLILLLSAVSAFAQAAMTQTTLSTAMLINDNQIIVGSATGFAANNLVVIDGEAMVVRTGYVSGTTIPVIRGGQRGTVQAAHATSSVVFTGVPNYFYDLAPSPGPCTATAEVVLPRIVLARANAGIGGVSIYNCSGLSATTQTWQMYIKDGWPAYGFGALTGRASGAVTYTALGAITPQPGMIFINGTTLAMTIIDPTTTQNGMTMCIISTNASAQTVTYTAGFNGGTTSRDVATYGGAIGDNMCITAVGGVWWVISTRNVTFG